MNSEQKTRPRQPQKNARSSGQRRRSDRQTRRSTELKNPRKPTEHTGTTEVRRTRPPQRSKTVPGKGATVSARPPRQREAMPEVVYAPARPFSRNRFILQLVTVVAVVLAATFVISIFFKVKTVTVSGAEKYTAWDVYEASGIQEGDGLLTFSRARACGKITTALPYVKSVQIGIKLPDTVNIEIVESDVVYAVQAENSSWWLMTAEGKIVEQSDATAAENTTVIQGIKLLAPTLGEEAVVAQTGSLQDSSAGTIPVTVTAQERLNVLLEILQNLEMNGVIGEMASVDVSNLNDLQMWYGDRYQVKLGDRYKLDFKIERMALAISQMDDYQRGMLDVSYTTWSDKVGYTPFE